VRRYQELDSTWPLSNSAAAEMEFLAWHRSDYVGYLNM
jgi:hypothetical protein